MSRQYYAQHKPLSLELFVQMSLVDKVQHLLHDHGYGYEGDDSGRRRLRSRGRVVNMTDYQLADFHRQDHAEDASGVARVARDVETGTLNLHFHQWKVRPPWSTS